jgi:two-component sensor histidine kinase
MVSELVTNGMRFGLKDKNEAIFIDLRVAGKARCEVSGAGLGVVLEEQPSEPGRWGLRVPDWLAERWGVAQVGDATRIWFELSTTRTAARHG